MVIHRLMIKTHAETGLKYLCYTRARNWRQYTGSGVYWKRHLAEHGANFTTELLLETEDLAEFKKVAIQKSIEFDVVESDEWANLKIEEGDGGDTVSSKMWITNGSTDIYVEKTDQIPAGWKKGRSRCVFKNSLKQKEFASRVDVESRGRAIKQAWQDGKCDHRDHSKCGKKGDDNVACRPEVKEKIRNAALKRWLAKRSA